MKRFYVFLVLLIWGFWIQPIAGLINVPDPLKALGFAPQDYQIENSTTYNWNAGWYPTSQNEYHYNASNQTALIVSKSFVNNAWVFSGKTEYVYNGQSQIAELISYQYQNNAWINQLKTVYIYNADQIGSIYTYQWNANVWDQYYRMAYQYQSSNLHMITGEQFSGGQWVLNLQYTYSYGTANQVTELLMRIYYNSSEFYEYRYLYSYGAHELVTQAVLQQKVDNINWQNASKTLYTYDPDLNRIEALYQSWINASGTWINASRQQSSYDSNNCVTQDLNQNWQNNSWLNSSKTEYNYSFVSLEDLIVPELNPVLRSYPNPFSDQLTIDLKADCATIKIYNKRGQFVAELKSSDGSKIVWNGKDQMGKPVANGIYLLRATSGSNIYGSKIMLIR